MSLMVIQVLAAVLSTRSDRQSTGTDLDSMLWGRSAIPLMGRSKFGKLLLY